MYIHSLLAQILCKWQQFAAILLCLSLAQASLATEPSQAPVSLVELYQALGELPQDQKELVQQTSRMIFNESLPLINSLILSTQPQEAGALIDALSNGQDPAVTARLLVQFESSGIAYIRFLEAVQEKISTNPHLQRKIQASLSTLNQHVKNQPLPSIPIGQRLLNSALFCGSIVGFVYSFYGSFIQPSGDTFVDFSKIVAEFMGFHLLINVAAEFQVIRQTFQTWKTLRAEKKEALKVIKDMSKMLEIYKTEPLIEGLITNVRYMGTKQARIDAQTLLPNLVDGVAQNIEKLKENPAAYSQLMAFYQTREFLTLMDSLRDSLTENEKKHLRENSEFLSSRPEHLPVDALVLQFENRMIMAFQSYLNSPSNKIDELRQAVLREFETHQNKIATSAQMRKWDAFSNISLSVGITIMGAMASIGKLPVPIDASFFPPVINWIRSNTGFVLNLSALATLPSITRFYWELGKLGRKRRAQWSEAKKAEKLDSLMKILHSDFLLTSIESSKGASNFVYEGDAHSLIQSLLDLKPDGEKEYFRALPCTDVMTAI